MSTTRTHVGLSILAGAPVVLALLAVGCRGDPPARPPLKVAAAADLAVAFPELGALFEAQTGHPVVFSFGSSGLLAQQVGEGGPFDVYASANVRFVDQVLAQGRCAADSRVIYGVGRVGIWSRTRAYTLDELTGPGVVKVAIPDPEHAPYGMAAQQAVEAHGMWSALKPRLVYGDNARHALQLAESGNVEAAFVPLALALATPGGHFTLIDATQHAPLEQGMVACGDRLPLARRFIALVMSPEGRALMGRHGFVLPGEAPAPSVP